MNFLRWPLRLVGGLVAVALFYMLAAVVGGLLPVGPAAGDNARPHEIFIQSNGIHLEFVLPSGTLGTLLLAERQLPGPAAPYTAFGWGERDFFLKTPTWGDFDLSIAVGAVLWQRDILMRVRPVYGEPSGPLVRRLMVTDAQFGKIAEFIGTAIYLSDAGHPVHVESKLYDPGGIFLEGRGLYTPFYTCNEWVNDGLQQAEIRTAAWSPFPHGVMWQLD